MVEKKLKLGDEARVFIQGQEAFEGGRSPENNPYPWFVSDYDAWQSGYMDADIQESGG